MDITIFESIDSAKRFIIHYVANHERVHEGQIILQNECKQTVHVNEKALYDLLKAYFDGCYEEQYGKH